MLSHAQTPNPSISGNFLIGTLGYSGIGDAMYAIRYFDFYRNHVPESQLKVFILIKKENVRGLLDAVKDFVDAKMIHMVAVDTKNTLRFSSKDEQALQQKNILIVSSENKINSFPLYDHLVKNSKVIKNFLANTEVFLNAAVPLANASNTPFSYIKKTCKVFSLLEVGGQKLKNLPEDKSLLAKVEYREAALGFYALSLNRLFLCNKIKEYQAVNLTFTPESFDNQVLARAIFPKDPETVLAIGYQQRQSASLFYYDMLAGAFVNKTVKIISNTSYLSSEVVEKSAAMSRASKVIVYDANGNETMVVTNQRADNTTVLQFYDFSGIGHKDKQMYLALADVSLGSGDNSYMEGLSAGALCLWDVPQWKTVFVNKIQNFAKEKGFYLLERYFEKLEKIATEIGFEYLNLEDINDFTQFIKKNYEKLRLEFQKFADLLFQQYNLCDILIPMLTDNTKFVRLEPQMDDIREIFKLVMVANKDNKDYRALVKLREQVLSVLKKDDVDQLRKLTKNHPYLRLEETEFNTQNEENIFQMAVILNAVKCWDYIYRESKISPAKAILKLASNLSLFDERIQQALYNKSNGILADQSSKDLKVLMGEVGMTYSPLMLNSVLQIKIEKGAQDWREIYNDFKGKFSPAVEMMVRKSESINPKQEVQHKEKKSAASPQFFKYGVVAVKKIMPTGAVPEVQKEIDALRVVVKK